MPALQKTEIAKFHAYFTIWQFKTKHHIPTVRRAQAVGETGCAAGLLGVKSKAVPSLSPCILTNAHFKF